MRKRALLLCLLAALALLLCACSLPRLSARATPTPEPTPPPTPEPTPPPTSWTITDESAEQILALAEITSLRSVDATASREYDALLTLSERLPDCEVRWEYEFQGAMYPSDTVSLKVTSLEGLEDAIRCLPKLEYIDLIETDATVEDLDRYDAIRPGIFYYWSFWFDGFHIRTDIRVYSSLRDAILHRFTSEELYPMLKYCRHLRALDLGHNAIDDISLIGELKELEVLILADNPIVDASPLGKLENLSYLELFMCHEIEDFSFLNKLTRLRELNLCYDEGCTSLDFLEYMPDFCFGSFKLSGVSAEEFNRWQAMRPEAKMVFWDGNIESCDSGWRDTQRNYLIRYAFTSWPHITEYRNFDDVDYDFSTMNYPNYY